MMKKWIFSALLMTVLVSCKKDDEKENVNCSNDFAFIQKEALATYDYLDLIGAFDKLTIQYTPSSASTKVELSFSGTSSFKATLYYSACGSKLYQSKNSDMKDAQLVVDFNTPVNDVFKASTVSAQGQLIQSEYRIVDKNYEFISGDKTYTGYKIENVQFLLGEYMALGYEVISKEFGLLETSTMSDKRELISYE